MPGAQEDELSPGVFAPVVRQFALARPMAVRHLAAQALAPLVMPEQLGAMLESILSDVPCSPPISSHNQVSPATFLTSRLDLLCIHAGRVETIFYWMVIAGISKPV